MLSIVERVNNACYCCKGTSAPLSFPNSERCFPPFFFTKCPLHQQLRSEKTDRGERKPGVFVLHPQWLWESIAHWLRVPEEPYVAMLRVLDAAEIRPSGGGAAPSPLPSANGMIPTINLIDPSSSSIPLSTGGEQRSQAEDGDGESPAVAVAGPVVDESVDWAAVDEEVDAFLNETDDDDMDDSGVGETGSGYVSDSSAKSGVSKYVRQFYRSLFPSCTLSHFFFLPVNFSFDRGNRKRRRSPSASSSEESGVRVGKNGTGSPLSKRLKLSRDRQGQSKLKVEVFQETSNHSTPASSEIGDDDDDDGASSMNEDKLEDDSDLEERAEGEELDEIEADMRDATDDEDCGSEEDDDDDFLARDIEFG